MYPSVVASVVVDCRTVIYLARSLSVFEKIAQMNASSGPPSVSSAMSQHRRSLSAGREGSTAVPTPCPVFAGTRVLRVACGSRHTLAVVAGGEAYSWGWGACGQVYHVVLS